MKRIFCGNYNFQNKCIELNPEILFTYILADKYKEIKTIINDYPYCKNKLIKRKLKIEELIGIPNCFHYAKGEGKLYPLSVTKTKGGSLIILTKISDRIQKKIKLNYKE